MSSWAEAVYIVRELGEKIQSQSVTVIEDVNDLAQVPGQVRLGAFIYNPSDPVIPLETEGGTSR